jgi:nucleoside-diphosphate-sugar epimerase
VYFITGATGFIGRRVVRALALARPDARFCLLTEPRQCSLAERLVAADGLTERCQVVPGDLTDGALGITDVRLLAQIEQVWHLAALYDLSAPLPRSQAVNVRGTENVLRLCQRAANCERLVYFSTCYVAGKRVGPVLEDELDCGQSFHNHYEATKFHAEVLVRNSPVAHVILRPAVVVGDSRTGETDKYDGPYYIVRTALRLPRWLPLPVIGRPQGNINIVPVDFVVASAVHIGLQGRAAGRTFHLADPDPPALETWVGRLCAHIGRPPPRGRVPSALASAALRWKPLERIARIPHTTVPYLDYPVRFDTRNTQLSLQGSEISCPHFDQYLPILLDYVRRHPDKPFLDGRAF